MTAQLIEAVYAEAANRTVPPNSHDYRDRQYALAALIPHQATPGKHGCTLCGMEPPAAIHHWDDRHLGDTATEEAA